MLLEKNLENNKKLSPSDEAKLVIAAQSRYDQTQFPSADPRLIYKLGYMQGIFDCQNNLMR